MSKQALFIGAVASIITINSVFADTTVTSKQYVYTTRQATIPAAGTNANTPGSTVVTYTGTAGQIGERGIFNPETDFDEDMEIVSGHEGDLVTEDFIVPAVNNLMWQMDDMPTKYTTNKVCVGWIEGLSHTDSNCILWNLTSHEVYGRCNADIDCGSQSCQCIQHRCSCIE